MKKMRMEKGSSGPRKWKKKIDETCMHHGRKW